MKAKRILAALACLLLAGMFISCGKLFHVYYTTEITGVGKLPATTSFWEGDALDADNLPECIDEEYVFEYWYRKGDETKTPVTPGDHFEGDVTLVAKWNDTLRRTKKVQIEVDELFTPNSKGEYNYRYKTSAEGVKPAVYETFKVTLKTEATGAKIRYVIDGKERSHNGSTYELELGGGQHTISAYAESTGYAKSITTTKIFNVDPGVTAPDHLTIEAGDVYTSEKDGKKYGQCTLRYNWTDDKDLVYLLVMEGVNGTVLDDPIGYFEYPNFSSAVAIDSLEIGTPYFFSIAVSDDWGNVAISNIVYYTQEDNSKETVASITATPSYTAGTNGYYRAGTTVTLTTSTPDAVIYYTTDGKMPTSASSVYNEPIALVAGENDIRAVAVKEDWNDSQIFSAVYTVDAKAPSKVTDIEVTSYGDGILIEWTNPDDDDLDKVELLCGLHGTQLKVVKTLTSTSVTDPLVPGELVGYDAEVGDGENDVKVGNTYDYQVRATDLAGNASESPVSWTMIKDTGAADLYIQ